jgi:hypothetical protein
VLVLCTLCVLAGEKRASLEYRGFEALLFVGRPL